MVLYVQLCDICFTFYDELNQFHQPEKEKKTDKFNTLNYIHLQKY